MHNNLNDIIDKISGKTLQEKLFTLSKCNCCPRHSINKPFMFTPWKEEETKEDDYTYICIYIYINVNVIVDTMLEIFVENTLII